MRPELPHLASLWYGRERALCCSPLSLAYWSFTLEATLHSHAAGRIQGVLPGLGVRREFSFLRADAASSHFTYERGAALGSKVPIPSPSPQKSIVAHRIENRAMLTLISPSSH